MSVENDFLIFANDATNIESQTDYVADPAVVAGVGSGIASSSQANKIFRQATTGMALLAAFIQQQLPNQTVLDEGQSGLPTLLSSFTQALETISSPWIVGLWQDSGIANEIEITLSPTPSSLSALEGHLLLVQKIGTANTGPLTISVNASSAVAVLRSDGSQFAAGEWAASAIGTIIYNGTNFICTSITSPALYALLNSPAFTGTPTAPTAAPGNSTTQLATTAFVVNEATAVENYLFDLQTPSTSGNITLSSVRTIVMPMTTAAITLTMQPGTIVGQWCEIVGTGAGVTVQSNVSSGNPVFTLPDGSNVYSFPLTTYGASLVLIWDGLNWRAQTIGQTVVATTTANNQAPPLSQVQAQFAALNGNSNESFYASELYAASLQGYGVFLESNNSALVCNSGYTASVNYANNGIVPHQCAPASTATQAVTLGQFDEPISATALASGNDNTVSATVSFSAPGPGLLIASGSRNNSASTSVANQVTLYINGNNVGTENSSSSATIFGTATTSGGTVSAECSAALSIPFSARVSLTWIPFGLIT
jgi:hypothetical protein